MLPTIKETYDIKVNLGSSSINLTSWKGKDIDTITNIVGEVLEVDNLTDEQLEALVTPYIENYNNQFFTRQELIFCLYKLRSASLDEDIEFSYVCQECEHPYNDKKNLLEVCEFTPGQYDVLKVANHEFKLEPQVNKKIYLEKTEGMESDYQKVFTEMLLRISEFNFQDTTYEGYSFDELKDYIDTLNINSYNEILESYIDKTPSFQALLESTCPECKETVKIDIDIIPTFFSDL